jgi:hypothetical protein
MYPICKQQLDGYYGIVTRQVHPLMNLNHVWYLIHLSTNLMLLIFHSSINEPNVCTIFIDPLTNEVYWSPLQLGV